MDGAVFSFEVGQGKVIRAWDIAVKTMKVRRFLPRVVLDCVLTAFPEATYLFRAVTYPHETTLEPLTLRPAMPLHQISLPALIAGG